MSALPATIDTKRAEAIERVVIQGDLARLSPEERVSYYRLVCESVGLNPLTKPFEFITLNGKLTLYARKDATDQLRSLHQVSVRIVGREVVEGCYVVTAQASFPSGRVDESIGAVPIDNLKGEARANSLMKAETKAKRRVTLSACGLGMLDELEIETIPSAAPPSNVARTTEAIPISSPAKAAVTETVKGSEPQKAADKQPEVAGPPVTAASTREPGSGGLDKGQCANFGKSFREALPPSREKESERLRHEWLGLNFFLDKEGNPSSEAIPKAEYEQWKRKAIAWAKAQPA